MGTSFNSVQITLNSDDCRSSNFWLEQKYRISGQFECEGAWTLSIFVYGQFHVNSNSSIWQCSLLISTVAEMPIVQEEMVYLCISVKTFSIERHVTLPEGIHVRNKFTFSSRQFWAYIGQISQVFSSFYLAISNIFQFSPGKLWKWSNLANAFQRHWNHLTNEKYVEMIH